MDFWAYGWIATPAMSTATASARTRSNAGDEVLTARRPAPSAARLRCAERAAAAARPGGRAAGRPCRRWSPSESLTSYASPAHERRREGRDRAGGGVSADRAPTRHRVARASTRSGPVTLRATAAGVRAHRPTRRSSHRRSPGAGAPAAPEHVADRAAPAARLLSGIRDASGFARGKGPRELRASVDRPVGPGAVKLRLTRRRTGAALLLRRVAAPSSARAAGAGFSFKVGDRAGLSLPAAERASARAATCSTSIAVDGAGNRDAASGAWSSRRGASVG